MRKETNVRLNPTKGKKGIELSIPNSDFSYGKPTKPATPIKNVVHNYYGEAAASETVQRYDDISKIVTSSNNGYFSSQKKSSASQSIPRLRRKRQKQSRKRRRRKLNLNNYSK